MNKMKIMLAAALLFCTAGLAKAGYSTWDINLADVTAETASTMASTDLIAVYDTSVTGGAIVWLDATDIGGLGSGATKAEIDQAADVSARHEDVTAANTLTTAECGKVMTLNSATEFASTLPAPSAGCSFTFFVKAAPSGADYTIVTDSGADVIVIGVNELEVDTADDGPYDDNADTVSFKGGIAVEGDYVKCDSTDGTKWYCFGQTNADGGITTSTT
jgi:hypothetical protein